MNFLKIKLGLLSLLAVLAVSVLLTSCEQEILTPSVDTLELTTEEGDNTDMTDNSETGELLFHAHFDADMTAEEAQEQWGNMLSDYVNNLDMEQLEYRGTSNRWKTTLAVFTGESQNNQTNGRIEARMNFKTNRGTSTFNWINLPNAGKQGWHFYYHTNRYNSNASVSWVEGKWAEFRLRGTDGWYLRHVRFDIEKNQQAVSASGGSKLRSNPYVWLDSNNSSAWDVYKASGGYGRLNF